MCTLIFDLNMDIVKCDYDTVSLLMNMIEKLKNENSIGEYVYYTFDENLKIFQVLKLHQLESLSNIVCVPQEKSKIFLQNFVYASLEYFDLV